ncbi:MAG: hypothetical protein JHC98_01450 [Thermoleophilaceae bacterium]|nr:hypothetical protein [Thermoleophilaceae bacterium]
MPAKSLPKLLAAGLLLVALACTGTASAAIPAGNTGWSWANPLPQGNTLDRLEVSGGRIWAGGATGTLLYSDDGGANWTAVRTGLLDDIRTIEAISPNSVVFAGRCALRRSDDGGATVRRLAWGSSDDSCAAQIQAVSFPSPLIGYLLLTNGDVYATGDAGDSWNKQGVAPGSVASNGTAVVRDISFTSVSTGVLSVGNRVMQTVDAGVSWTPVKTADTGAGLFNFEFLGTTTGYAVGDHSDILKTTDSGATWNAVPGDFATRNSELTSLSCADESACIATIGSSSSILRTADGGAHWAAAVLPADAIYAAGFLNGTDAVAVGSGGATARSVDAGATWTPTTSVAAGKFTGIRIDSPASALIFGEQGAIARSTDAGKSWKPLTPPHGVKITDAVAVGAQRIYAISNSVALSVSSDGGRTWKVQNTGKNVASRAIFAWTGSRVMLVGLHGVRISTKGGAKANPVRGKVAKLSLKNVDAAAAAVFVYGDRDIASTFDKGKTWKIARKPRGAGRIKRLDMVDAKYGYLLDSKAELFATRNGARSWTRVETTGANVAESMAFGDRKHGYITDNTGRVLATNDAGATWSRQYPFYDQSGQSNSLVATARKLSATTLVVGTNRVFTSDTGGRIGSSSHLTLSSSAAKVRKGTIVRVTGKLTPAVGTERVAVLARVRNAKGGTRWISQERTVSSTGTFTTSWRITAATEFIARWSGDASHDGDAAPLVVVKLRK